MGKMPTGVAIVGEDEVVEGGVVVAEGERGEGDGEDAGGGGEVDGRLPRPGPALGRLRLPKLGPWVAKGDMDGSAEKVSQPMRPL